MKITLMLVVLVVMVGCSSIGPNGPNTATGGFDPSTLFQIGKIMAGKEAEKRYGVNPFEFMNNGQASQVGGLSWAEIGSTFAIYEAGRTNATMKDLFQIIFEQKHPVVIVPTLLK